MKDVDYDKDVNYTMFINVNFFLKVTFSICYMKQIQVEKNIDTQKINNECVQCLWMILPMSLCSDEQIWRDMNQYLEMKKHKGKNQFKENDGKKTSCS